MIQLPFLFHLNSHLILSLEKVRLQNTIHLQYIKYERIGDIIKYANLQGMMEYYWKLITFVTCETCRLVSIRIIALELSINELKVLATGLLIRDLDLHTKAIL